MANGMTVRDASIANQLDISVRLKVHANGIVILEITRTTRNNPIFDPMYRSENIKTKYKREVLGLCEIKFSL